MVEGRTYRPVVQPEKCQVCSVCVRECPAETIPEYRNERESLRSAVYRKRGEAKERKKVVFSPCQEACPIGQNARGYVALIGKGEFKEAMELIREVNPLPAVCGYVCHHPCEEACLREGIDSPVPIRRLKRFVMEYGQHISRASRRKKRRREKILVIGSGPAGLAAANDLSLMGFGVTLFEALPVLGGMLRVGIPEFRLPRDVLRKEIEGIQALGVEMITGRRFDFDENGKTIRRLGFQAAFLSIGAHRSLRLKIPGETLKGVFPGVEFLRGINLGEQKSVPRRIAVIGGGNVALDAARSALRMGAENVEIYYRRSRKEMPAIPDEVDEAIREGIKVHLLSSPIRILGRGDRAIGMECIRMQLGEADQDGRRRPLPIEGSNFRVRAEAVISAVGQGVDGSLTRRFDTHQDGTLRTDPKTGETSMKGVFAGGDAVTGPGWAIDAIAAGKKAARAIEDYLS